MKSRLNVIMLPLAVVASASTMGQQQRDDCGPAALAALVAQDYEHRIWQSLGKLRRLEDSCGVGDAASLYLINRAQLESFVGNHRAALQFADRGRTRADRTEALPDNARSLDAVAYLTRRAKDRRIVMVNERHHVSTDRLLTLALLKPLADLGFRYLALEAAWNGDDVNGRGYAVGGTGYYINDPVFAEVVREAVGLGYRVVAYEIEDEQRDKDVEGRKMGKIEKREYWQARNLVERVFDKDPAAKVLIHCGYGHLVKARVTMGYFLTQMTDMDPLTVGQVVLSERGSVEFENPIRVAAEGLGLVSDIPVVLVDDEGRLLDVGKSVDVTVLGPRTAYRHGRPTWMALGGRRRDVPIEVPECERTSCIVEARRVDWPDSVPLDRVEVRRDSFATLYLPAADDVEIQVFDVHTQERLGQRRIAVGFSADNGAADELDH